MSFRVVIVGTGALARTVCASVATLGGLAVRVTVVGRSADHALDVVRRTRQHAPVRVVAHPSDTDAGAGLAAVVAGHRPDVVLQCASWHSPWESGHRRSAWTDLVADAGFGVSLPLQAAPAALVAAALPAESLFVNGCLPDVTNAVLHRLDLRVLCGIGNAATLWDHLPPGPIRLLAHHVHLHRPARPGDEALAWIGDEPVPDVGGLLADLRALPRPALNERAGPPAALLVKHLLTGEPMRMSVPGPLGLPGGYPVIVQGRQTALDLPAAVCAAAAAAWNQRMSALDGVVVHSTGRVSFAEPAAQALSVHLPHLAAGFDVDDLPSVARELLRLRERLRRAPARGVPGTDHSAPDPCQAQSRETVLGEPQFRPGAPHVS